MGKQFWTIFWVVVLGGIAVVVYLAATSGPATFVGKLSEPVTSADWVKGDLGAKAVLVEYGDFQCPACSAYAPWVWQLAKEFKPTELAVVFRHFPLPQHQNAVPSARAAEAAGTQGQFWEMAELLYTHQDEWSELRAPEAKFREYAATLKLDLKRFDADYQNSAPVAKIEAQKLAGNRSLVNATPTFFLNGQVLAENPQSYEQFKQLIQTATLATSTPAL
jgi:protein-disulfide isomerase